MLSRVRALWRAARTWPIAGSIIEAADRAWWARTIHRAHIVDIDFVSAMAGRRLGARAAVRAYVRGGFRRGMSLNPLFVESRVSRQLSDSARVPALYAYLVNDRERLSVSPQWDAVAYAARHPEALADPAGQLGHLWRAAMRGAHLALGPADATTSVAWTDFLALACRAAAEAREANAPIEHHARDSGQSFDVTLIAVIGDDGDDGDRVIELVGAAAAALGATAVIGTRHPDPDSWVQLALATLRISGSRVRRIPLPPDELLSQLESEVASGTIVTRGPCAEISLPDLLAIAASGVDRPTAPLWLGPDGTIASAGVGEVRGQRIHLLAGLTAEDARALGEQLDVQETAGHTRAYRIGATLSPRTLLRATVVASAQPPLAGSVDGGADTDVDSLIAPLGLHVSRWAAGTTGVPVYARNPDRTVMLEDGTSVPRLRWAIKTASPTGAAGESWGDTHFARGIAAALRRLGQHVVIDAFPARHRASGYLDDVTLVLRGPRRIEPSRHGTSLLWIISHPDEVTRDELDGFDAVFAASKPWAAAASLRFDRPIAPLLQCTDISLFHPTGAERTDEIVFVGTARGIARPSVVAPIAAGVPVSVYGPDWRGYIPGDRITATGIDNTRLPALYERAAVVLNDHWPAMQREGFISNRPYDVVAAGGRVISDDVQGLAEEFEGAVRVYHDVPQLLRLLDGDLDSAFPSEGDLARISQRIRAEHSFDARARSLLDAVTDNFPA